MSGYQVLTLFWLGGGKNYTPSEKCEKLKIGAGRRPAPIFHQTKFSFEHFLQFLGAIHV